MYLSGSWLCQVHGWLCHAVKFGSCWASSSSTSFCAVKSYDHVEREERRGGERGERGEEGGKEREVIIVQDTSSCAKRLTSGIVVGEL